MIDDLFSDLALGAIQRLLAPGMPREESDVGLARVNSRLSRQGDRDNELDLERRLFGEYSRLSLDDLADIPHGVHEWALEWVSQIDAFALPGYADTLRKLYFLFPHSSIRHSVVGLLLQGDDVEDGDHRTPGETYLASLVVDAINQDVALSSEERSEQMQALADFVLDYVDVYPHPAARALAAITATDPHDAITAYILSWADRVGGEGRASIRRVIGGDRGA